MKDPPLVTGANGFAGRHLVRHLLEHEPHVIAWSGPSARREATPAEETCVTWMAVDVTETCAVERALDRARPSAVYHCAGIADVHSSWTASARALQVNVMGTHTLLKGLQRAGARVPVLVTGSALVYRQSSEPLTEESPLAPSTPYGVSKLAQEMLAAAADGHIIITRPFNHAGPGQSDAYVTSSFARQIAEAEAGLREPVLRVGNLEARRDISDVRDTVRAYRALVQHGTPKRPYNVCRGEAYRVRDLMDALIRQARIGIRVETDPARLRPSDNPVLIGSAARLQTETGWTPQIPIQQTLADLLDYWRATVTRRR